MPKNRKIMVIGKQRPVLDAGLVAQVLLVLGKRLWDEQHRTGGSSSEVPPDECAGGDSEEASK